MKIIDNLKKNEKMDKWDYFGWMCVLVGLILNSIIIYKGTWNFIHSDDATAILFAKEQISQKKMYPEGWWYGTDIWNIGLNTLVIPFLFLCKNWLNARVCAVILQTLLMVVIILGFRKFKITGKRVWIVILFMLLPISEVISEHWYFQATYMTIILFLIGMILTSYMILSEKKKNRIMGVILLLAILTIRIGGSCMMILVFALPMIGAMAFQAIREIHNGEKKEKIYKYLLCIIAICLGVGLGMIYNKYLLANINGTPSGTSDYSFVTHKEIWSSIGMFVENILRLYGVIDKNAALLSLNGINKVMATVCFCFFVLYLPYCLVKNFSRLKHKYQQIFLTFSILSSIAVIYLCIVANMPQSRYLIWCYFYSILWFGIWIDNYDRLQYEYGKELKWGIGAFCVVMFCGVYSYYMTYDYETNEDILGVNNRFIDYKVDYELLEYLEKNDYEFGYSTYWSAYSNIVASNGKVKIAAITYDWKQPYYWLNSEKWYQKDVYDGKCFVLLTKKQQEGLPELYKEKAVACKEYRGHIILEYSSVEDVQEIWKQLVK